jgi:hypothetical protein
MNETTTTTTETTTEITVCSECAAGIANDDWTHLDFHHDTEGADEAMATIQGSLELWGWLSLKDGNVDTNGYFRCPCCGDDAIDGATFTAERTS